MANAVAKANKIIKKVSSVIGELEKVETDLHKETYRLGAQIQDLNDQKEVTEASSEQIRNLRNNIKNLLEK